MATEKQIQTIAQHFIIAALWADAPEGTRPRATLATMRKAEAYARQFVDMCGPLFDQAMQCEGYGSHPDAGSPEAAFGHDLWLTSQGHGVGFWDRDELGELGDKLADLLSDSSLYVEPEFYRGWLYFNGRGVAAANARIAGA